MRILQERPTGTARGSQANRGQWEKPCQPITSEIPPTQSPTRTEDCSEDCSTRDMLPHQGHAALGCQTRPSCKPSPAVHLSGLCAQLLGKAIHWGQLWLLMLTSQKQSPPTWLQDLAILASLCGWQTCPPDRGSREGSVVGGKATDGSPGSLVPEVWAQSPGLRPR